MRVFSFHLMPYPGLPDDYVGPAWVTVPNALFDPEVGQVIYHRYLDELVYADELGFDGVCVNEHHQNAYGLMPSPNLMGADPRPRDQAGEDLRRRQRPAAVRPADCASPRSSP